MAHHAALAEGEAEEHPEGVERDEAGGLCVEQEEKQRCERCEHDNPPAEDQPVPAGVEEAGDVAIPREDRCEPGKVSERGVRGEDQDTRGHDVEQGEEDGAIPERLAAELGEDRVVFVRDKAVVASEQGRAHEEKGEDAAHPEQCGAGVLGSGLLERLHAVADRLHAGHRTTSAGKRLQQEKQSQAFGAGNRLPWCARSQRIAGAEDDLHHRNHDRACQQENEGVRGDREDGAGFTHATQVDEGDEENDANRQRHGVGTKAFIQGRQGIDPRRHRDGDGEHVIHEQRGRRDQSRADPQVFVRDDVRAAAVGVGPHRLPVAGDDDGQEDSDGDGDRQRPLHSARAGEQQNEEDLLRRVGDRRDGVRREDGERLDLAQPFPFEAGVGERGAKDAVAHIEVAALQAGAAFRVGGCFEVAGCGLNDSGVRQLHAIACHPPLAIGSRLELGTLSGKRHNGQSTPGARTVTLR